MFIYVSGPYSPSSDEKDPDKREKIIDKNIRKAEEVALDITKKGHFPFVPHTMMRGWEDGGKVSREKALQICHKWIERCDALFFIAPSAGAESERQVAVKLSLPIYRNIEDIPNVTSDTLSRMSPEALNAHLIEYQECMESYRHTYDTIWQAGALFAALTVGLITFAQESIKELSLLPIIFWCFGIFTPMNRYGELRNDRLVAIEQLLNATVPGLKMAHFSDYSRTRKNKDAVSIFNRVFSRKWGVSLFIMVAGTLCIVVQAYLIWVNYVCQFFR